jgi:4-hydroxybenzoate polyprenyltransferase
MKNFIDLLRVRQWVKNLFMIAPLIFSAHFGQIYLWQQCLLAVIGFCFISSGMYIINDIADLKKDRLHTKKSQRPLAAGKVSVIFAKKLAVIVLLLGCALSFWQGMTIFVLAISYILLHSLYNIWSKNVMVLDVFTVAFGFEIRIWAGAVAVGVMPSVWLQVCMFVLALFLGFAKRRCEIIYLESEASAHRSVFSYYTLSLLDQMIMISSTLSILIYGLYTVSSEVKGRIHGLTMFYSIAFVIFGIFRYLYLLYIKKIGDDPTEALLSDTPMIVNIMLWLLFVVSIIRFSHI